MIFITYDGQNLLYHYRTQYTYEYVHTSQIREQLWQGLDKRAHYYLMQRQRNELMVSPLQPTIEEIADGLGILFVGTARELYDVILPHLEMMRAL